MFRVSEPQGYQRRQIDLYLDLAVVRAVSRHDTVDESAEDGESFVADTGIDKGLAQAYDLLAIALGQIGVQSYRRGCRAGKAVFQVHLLGFQTFELCQQGEDLRPERPNRVWSCDFVESRMHDGTKSRMLDFVDEFTRECLAIRVNRTLKSTAVIDVPTAIYSAGWPGHVRSDNGPESVAKAVRDWIGAVAQRGRS